MDARSRAHVDEVVGRPHEVLVVFHHHDGVAQVAQRAQHLQEPDVVAGVQADAGFIEDVERAGEVAAQTAGQLDALGLATAQRVGGPVEGEVSEPDVQHHIQPPHDLGHELLADLLLVLGQFNAPEEGVHLGERSGEEFVDVASVHQHVAGLGRSRPPLHSVHRVFPRYRDSMTRYWIL